MHPNGGIPEVLVQRTEVVDSERIDQHAVFASGELDEAEGFAVAVEAVRLGIDRTYLFPINFGAVV